MAALRSFVTRRHPAEQCTLPLLIAAVRLSPASVIGLPQIVQLVSRTALRLSRRACLHSGEQTDATFMFRCGRTYSFPHSTQFTIRGFASRGILVSELGMVANHAEQAMPAAQRVGHAVVGDVRQIRVPGVDRVIGGADEARPVRQVDLDERLARPAGCGNDPLPLDLIAPMVIRADHLSCSERFDLLPVDERTRREAFIDDYICEPIRVPLLEPGALHRVLGADDHLDAAEHAHGLGRRALGLLDGEGDAPAGELPGRLIDEDVAVGEEQRPGRPLAALEDPLRGHHGLARAGRALEDRRAAPRPANLLQMIDHHALDFVPARRGIHERQG
jgi:hypothetical protein